MATNRPDTLDPALVRPGRIDRRIEFAVVCIDTLKFLFRTLKPDLESRANILKIHTKRMSVDRNIRYELISRLCPNTTGIFTIIKQNL
jgi:26S proteasome regulatory subunit T1